MDYDHDNYDAAFELSMNESDEEIISVDQDLYDGIENPPSPNPELEEAEEELKASVQNFEDESGSDSEIIDVPTVALVPEVPITKFSVPEEIEQAIQRKLRIMSVFEFTAIVGHRYQQLCKGSPPCVDYAPPEKLVDALIKEFRQGRVPLWIKKNGERIRVSEFSNVQSLLEGRIEVIRRLKN